MTNARSGYTLVELAVVVAITAVLAGAGLPSLGAFLAGRRMDAQVGALTSSLRLARSEAMRRGERVTVCRSTDGAQCGADASARDWSSGWIVFLDRGARGVVDASDRVLAVQAADPRGPRIVAAGTGLYVVSYLPSGLAPGAQNNLRFLPADDGGAAPFAPVPRIVCISITGGARVAKASAC